MQRNRTLSQSQDAGIVGLTTAIDYTHVPAWNSKSITRQDGYPVAESEHNINDFVIGYGEARIVDGKWKRIKKRSHARPSGPVMDLSVLRPVYPCTHTKTVIKYQKHLVTEHSRMLDLGNPIWERLYTRTANFDSAASLLPDNGHPVVYEVSDLSDSTGSYYSSDYRKHDWFNLMSRFNEACDQIIPSSLVVGEDIVENDVYKLAFKNLLKPHRMLQEFLKYVGTMPRRYRKGSLGHIAKKIRQDKVTVGEVYGATFNKVADGHLFYNFAVRPAISTIEDSLNAHNKVGKKLEFLRSHGGQFVPVRVRTDLMSDMQNNPLRPVDPDVWTSFQWQVAVKRTTAVIGAWGRVRRDFEWSDVWHAYIQYFGLNKVVGLMWELIPYSFVVDWFTNTQERINELTRIEGPQPYTEFGRLWASEKKTLIEELYCIPGLSPVLTAPMIRPDAPFVVLERETTEYSRWPRIPDSSGVVDLSNFTSFHATLLTALLPDLKRRGTRLLSKLRR